MRAAAGAQALQAPFFAVGDGPTCSAIFAVRLWLTAAPPVPLLMRSTRSGAGSVGGRQPPPRGRRGAPLDLAARRAPCPASWDWVQARGEG